MRLEEEDKAKGDDDDDDDEGDALRTGDCVEGEILLVKEYGLILSLPGGATGFAFWADDNNGGIVSNVVSMDDLHFAGGPSPAQVFASIAHNPALRRLSAHFCKPVALKRARSNNPGQHHASLLHTRTA